MIRTVSVHTVVPCCLQLLLHTVSFHAVCSALQLTSASLVQRPRGSWREEGCQASSPEQLTDMSPSKWDELVLHRAQRQDKRKSSRGKERGAMQNKRGIKCSGGKMSREINTQTGRISPPPKKEKLWLTIHVCQCINKLGLYVHVCSITCMTEHTCTLSDVHMHSYRNICSMDSLYKLNMDACTDVQLYVCACMNKSFCLASRRT